MRAVSCSGRTPQGDIVRVSSSVNAFVLYADGAQQHSSGEDEAAGLEFNRSRGMADSCSMH
jgi:hypothetical protein